VVLVGGDDVVELDEGGWWGLIGLGGEVLGVVKGIVYGCWRRSDRRAEDIE